MVGRKAEQERRRRNEYLVGKSCYDCGSVDGLQVRWANPPGPFSSPGYIWRLADTKRESYLPLTKVQCVQCVRKAVGQTRIGVHGGGTQGIVGCKCGLCRARKSAYNMELIRRKRARQQALEALPKSPRGTLGQTAGSREGRDGEW